ncbi:copper amine oxidase N-terminal domain-containing protein [Desulforamulus aeronauticus]|uniref:Copper amine oxidase N-terminal domain-containing protein n=1 Tax=Desulforamulus aeronauticus DSM 10349 TaxID=1121421 RepID=A0A1M6SB71_9FIRM|nr:copper amine oxidase N-terminal domain-containing protein [Desulforamulus aeronauticus]SHK42004.1 Copper amine oxidase N-terminal domain-containing protein [Desulforamulus aeronauticus DSM 10349]
MKKQLVTVMLSALLLSTCPYNSFGEISNIKLIVNGKQIVSQEQPRVITGRTVVPLRAIAEALGTEVEWDDVNQSIKITKDNKEIKLFLNKSSAIIDGQNIVIDSPPIIINGVTFLPLRFLSEALGAEVKWNAENNTVIIEGQSDDDTNVPDSVKNWNSGTTTISSDSKNKANATDNKTKRHETWNSKEVNGDVKIEADKVIDIKGNVKINGDLYVYGTIKNHGNLKVTGAIHLSSLGWDDNEENGSICMLSNQSIQVGKDVGNIVFDIN